MRPMQIITVAAIAAVFIVAFMAGFPRYKVYHQRMEGEAELARATQNRQIKIQEAKAAEEAAIAYAAADTIRAHGVRRSNEIIAQSLKGNEEYLRYLYIQQLAEKNGDREIIYVPTEAGLPILEANRLKNKTYTSTPSE